MPPNLDLLRQQAAEVARLVQCDTNRDRFVEQIKLVIADEELLPRKKAGYFEGFRRLAEDIEAILREAQEDPRLTNKEAGPPDDNHVWHRHTTSEGEVLEAWIPRYNLKVTDLPSLPASRFYDDLLTRPFQPRDLRDRLPFCYFLLAFIHDRWLAPQLCVPIIPPGLCPPELEDRVSHRIQRGDPGFDPSSIVLALVLIRVDLEKLNHEPNEQGRNGMKSVPKDETPTPETDHNLIYLTAAAEFYDIPKSTLSKAAAKEPGQPGYLWSDSQGRRRWFRKSDIEKVSRSRKKLGGA